MASQSEIPNRGPGLLGGFMYGALGGIEQHAQEYREGQSARSLEDYRFEKEKELARFKEELDAMRYARDEATAIRKEGTTAETTRLDRIQSQREFTAEQKNKRLDREQAASEGQLDRESQERRSPSDSRASKGSVDADIDRLGLVLQQGFGAGVIQPDDLKSPSAVLDALDMLDAEEFPKKDAIKSKVYDFMLNASDWSKEYRADKIKELQQFFISAPPSGATDGGFSFKGRRPANG